MEIEPGCVVRSRAGHDKGRVYAVIAVENGVASVVDGELRKAAKPKRKNVRHLAYLGKLDTADAKNAEDHVLRKLLSSWR